MSRPDRANHRLIALRPALEADMPFVLTGTRELADAEGRPEAVTATAADLWRLLTTPGVAAECAIIERHAAAPIATITDATQGMARPRDTRTQSATIPVGHAWFFIHATTFAALTLLYIEDIVIHRAHRGGGLGRAAMGALARLARQRACAGMHWSVVDGNDDAARFYLRLGAEPKTGGGQFKIAGEAFERLAAE